MKTSIANRLKLFTYQKALKPLAFFVILFFTQANIHAAAPTTQASNLIFSSIQTNQLTATWTNGNGTGRAVFIYRVIPVVPLLLIIPPTLQIPFMEVEHK